MLKKISILIAMMNFLLNNAIAESKYEIVINVGNEIITNFDIQKETRYLLALNPSLNNLSIKQIKEISKNSLIREKIKENELIKYYKINYENPELAKFTMGIYSKLNIRNESEFKSYLSEFDLDIKEVIKKIAIERTWNRLIVEKFNNLISVDELKIKEGLENNQDKLQTQTSFLISEILFQSNNDGDYQKIYNNIIKTIEESSFKSAASIYSISDSSTNGGEIGWVNKNEISNSIYDALSKLDVGEFTKPIKIVSGFLIIYLNDLKQKEQEINLEEELKKIIVAEKNRQLNEYSIIYFKKIEKQILINEK